MLAARVEQKNGTYVHNIQTDIQSSPHPAGVAMFGIIPDRRLRRLCDRTGPRVHDFRHRFAIRTLLGWYQKNMDVEQQLPVLSTYLGHTCVRDTYWYLSACPELMQEAAQRLNRRWEARP